MRSNLAGIGSVLLAVLLVGSVGCRNEDTDGAKAGTPVNTICPMERTAVSASIPTREFRGKIVGFCCAHCPADWDKLSDTEKQTRLDAVMGGTEIIAPTTMPAGVDHEGHGH